MPSAPPPQRGFALRGHHPKQARRRRKDAHVQVEGAVTLKERQAAGRISWDLLDLLRDELTSLQDRAKFVIPIQITGLIGLWVQIASFDVGPDLVLYFKYMLVLRGESEYTLHFNETDELTPSQRGYVQRQLELFDAWYADWSTLPGAVQSYKP